MSKAPAMESPSERATRLMEEVRGSELATYTRGQVIDVLNSVAAAGHTCADSLTTVHHMQRGDVFIAKLVGGKVRPWVTLRVFDALVVAVGLSSGDSAPRMVKSQCRFWPGAWIGTTVSLFNEESVRHSVSRPYTALKHLREIEGGLAGLFGLRRQRVRK